MMLSHGHVQDVLYQRCIGKGLKCAFVEESPIERQIAELVNEYKAEMTFPEKMRCAKCNRTPRRMSRQDMKRKVPDDAYRNDAESWTCSRCEKAYWKGGHWKNITRMYEKVRQLIQTGFEAL